LLKAAFNIQELTRTSKTAKITKGDSVCITLTVCQYAAE